MCLAYIAHFGSKADAVIQWKGHFIVLGPAISRRLNALLTENGPRLRQRMVAILLCALPDALARRPRPGQLYLNVGHTGLNNPVLVDWVADRGLRAIYLIHDLIPIQTPQFCRSGEGDRHRQRMDHALKSATGIIGNSSDTINALRDYASGRDLPHPPMIVAWLAGDALPPPDRVPEADRPYFVILGTIEARKNHLLLLRLWQRLVERMGTAAPRLIVVGQRGWEAQDAFALLDDPALAGAVIEQGRCDDMELARLLLGARALLMPSFAEGFGMPVIEALQLGVPVIASDLAVFREIAHGIPTFLPPDDIVGWQAAIMDFCGVSPERERQMAAMQAYRAPDWTDHFAVVEPWMAGLRPAAPLPR